MRYQLLPLREQVIVITGASSGIGLVTANGPQAAVHASSSRRATKMICVRRATRFAVAAAAPSTSSPT